VCVCLCLLPPPLHLPEQQWVMFPLGVLLTVVGVFYLSQREITSNNSKRRSSAGGSIVSELNELHSQGEVGPWVCMVCPEVSRASRASCVLG
jgi:hypothetical protein